MGRMADFALEEQINREEEIRMTRKHYKVFAALLSRMRAKLSTTDICGRDTIDEFETICVEQFAKENPRFNAAKFREAAR